MSELKTNKISPATGTALAVGDSGDTITVPSGATLTVDGTLTLSDGSITNAKLADMAANTVKVRDANSSGVPSDKALASTEILIGDGTGFTAAALSGDVTMANTGAVTIATDAVDIAMLSATGTASASTYLRGDNAWSAISSSANTPYFHAKTSADSTWGSGSYTTIVLNSVVEESNTGSFDTSTYKFTVPSGEGGTYFLGGLFFIPSSVGAYYVRVKQAVGGTTELNMSSNQGNGNQNIQPAWTMALAAGDTLEWSLYGGTGATNGGNQVWGWKLW